MVLILPKGKYAYDLYPLTEQVIEVDDDGNDVSKEVFIDGVIEIAGDDYHQIRVSKKFADDLGSIVDMTDEEIAEEQRLKDIVDPRVEAENLIAKLAAMDYLTNKYVEGKLSNDRWLAIVQERDALRRQLKELRETHSC